MEFSKNQAVDAFGQQTVTMAEVAYETDFEKRFWLDLGSDERLLYIYRASKSHEEYLHGLNVLKAICV